MKDEPLKKNNGWKYIGLTKENFDLQKVVEPNFLKLFSEQFKGKKVEIIGVSVLISDKNIDYEKNKEEFRKSSIGVSISHNKIEDTENNKITVKITKDEVTEKIKSIIDEYEA